MDLFLYNWQVREDWFNWCEAVSDEELLRNRTGGMGSILRNLFHVADCEQLWIHQMQKRQPLKTDINTISSLDEVIKFSALTRDNTVHFLQNWAPHLEEHLLEINSKNGKRFSFTYGKVLRHIITHEVHHIGQLSIWARELGIKPVSSDLIVREYL